MYNKLKFINTSPLTVTHSVSTKVYTVADIFCESHILFATIREYCRMPVEALQSAVRFYGYKSYV